MASLATLRMFTARTVPPSISSLRRGRSLWLEQLTAFEVWLDHGSEHKKPPEQLLIVLQSCQLDLVKDGGHTHFIRFLDSMETFPEQRAMTVFVLAVIVDGHSRGQEACIEAGLLHVCLKHLQSLSGLLAPSETQNEPLFLKWLCLCLGKLWEDFTEAQIIAHASLITLFVDDIILP